MQKPKIHPRSKHRNRYDFPKLIATCPDLAPFVELNKYKDESINFFDPEAVRMLNKALLMHHYAINSWDIPTDYLCPPIPGRADYLHHIADAIAVSNNGKIPRGTNINCLDIGVGASCIYPIIGHQTYQWSFVGTDVDVEALDSAKNIVAANPCLKGQIELRKQVNLRRIFRGVIRKDELFDLTICNPPFHTSLAAAEAGTRRKLNNLTNKKNTRIELNFGGKKSELCYEGGEKRFIGNMIRESQEFATSCLWFSSLVSKEANLKSIETALKRADPLKVQIIPMGQGNKKSRLVAWTFLSREEHAEWVRERWKKDRLV